MARDPQIDALKKQMKRVSGTCMNCGNYGLVTVFGVTGQRICDTCASDDADDDLYQGSFKGGLRDTLKNSEGSSRRVTRQVLTTVTTTGNPAPSSPWSHVRIVDAPGGPIHQTLAAKGKLLKQRRATQDELALAAEYPDLFDEADEPEPPDFTGNKIIRLCDFCVTWQEFTIEEETSDDAWRAKSTHACRWGEISTALLSVEDPERVGSMTDPLPKIVCVACRQHVLESEIVESRYFVCCKQTHPLCVHCKDRPRGGGDRRNFFEWWTKTHVPVCGHRCADCDLFLENLNLRWQCRGTSADDKHGHCKPTRCDDCFAAHRASRDCSERGKSAPWRSADHACPSCDRPPRFWRPEGLNWKCFCEMTWAQKYVAPTALEMRARRIFSED